MNALILAICAVAPAAAFVSCPPRASAAAQSEAAARSLIDRAEAATAAGNATLARDLLRQAASEDSDLERRDRAAIGAASLEWHVFHDVEAARTLLARVDDKSRESSAAWSERARMETEHTRDFASARRAASTALERAKTLAERETALLRGARATIEEAFARRLEGKCPSDRDALVTAMRDLRAAADAGGATHEVARSLLQASLLAGDRGAAMHAWRWYDAERVPSVPSDADRRALAMALAGARLHREAEIVLVDPCASDEIVRDAFVRDVLAYAAALRRVDALTSEHFRDVARGAPRDDELEQAIGAESITLWRALSWPAEAPEFSQEAFKDELARRFGTVASLGRTDGVLGLLLGHAVLDERRTVEQYGRAAPLRFVLLDGMVSGGFRAWLTHGASGTGGWIGTDAIYQIRPMYADGPIYRWRQMTDPELRARSDQRIADESRQDLARAKDAPIAYLRGLDLRLKRQASDALRAELAASGLEGNALRDAFVERSRREEFDASIWAHEGRHAIDTMLFQLTDSAELEFRAKLSEVAFAPRPRGSLGSILSPVGPPTAHGIANQRALEGVVAWMREHSKDVAGLDADAPLLPQLDKLTDEQLRVAFRSIDPLPLLK